MSSGVDEQHTLAVVGHLPLLPTRREVGFSAQENLCWGLASMTNFHTVALSLHEGNHFQPLYPVPHSLWPHLSFQGQKDT